MSRITAKYLALLALAIVIFHWKTLLTDQFTTIVGFEAVNQTYAWLHFWVNSIWHGHLPLWDPYAFAGRPFTEEMAGFYPIRLLFALAPLNKNGLVSPHFYHEYLAFNRFLGAAFMFALLREFRRSHFAAFIGACAFSMGGMMARLPWPQYMEACIWLPAIFLFTLRSLRAESRNRALADAGLAGLCMGMSVLTGGVQFAMIQGIFIVAAFAYYAALHPRQRVRLATILGVTLAVAFGAGAVQLLPSFEYGHLSLRSISGGFFPTSEKIPFDRLVKGMWPQSIVTGVLPVGPPMGGEEAWAYYIGVFPMFLAVTAIWKRWSDLWVRFLSILAVIVFAYTLGEFSPLFGFLYAVVPYLWMARGASRFVYLISFSLAVLSAFGLDSLLEGAGQKETWAAARPFLKWIAIFVAAALLLPSVFTQMSLGIWTSMSLVLILGSCAWFFRLTLREFPVSGRVLLAAFLLFDLGVFFWGEADKNDLVKTGDEYVRLVTLRDATDFVKAQPGLNRVRVSVADEPSIGDVYGVQSAFGGAAVYLQEYSYLSQHEDLLNVRYRIKPASTPDPGALYEDKYWKVYKDEGGFPRAWVVHRTVSVPSDEAAFQRIGQPGIDLHNVAVIESPLPRPLNAAGGVDSVKFSSYEADSMSLDVKTSAVGLLVLSEFDYPGWRATVNGQSAEIHKVDSGLRGIVVPAGTSQVAFRYVPVRTYLGLGLSLSTFLCVLVAFQLCRREPTTGGSWVMSPEGPRPFVEGVRIGISRLIASDAIYSRRYLLIQIVTPFVLFIFLAGDAVTKFFGGDDVANLYWYYDQPLSHWLMGLVHFWSSDWYRPLGGVVYLLLFHAFGFHPLPFKVLLFAVLAGNMFLYLTIARKLSGSMQMATWALLLCSYHAALNGLYLNFGTIYDVLGYAFFFCAFLAYVTFFTASRRSLPGLLLVLFLYIAGLCCKEMVVTLPVVMLAYSVILSGSVARERLRWPLGNGLPVIACSVAAVFYTLGKMAGPRSLANMAGYAPHFNVGQFVTRTAHYLHELFYLSTDMPTPAGAILALALLFGFAFLMRSRLMLFSAISAVVTQLPVSFIEKRAGFVLYIPLAFWALWAVAFLDTASAVLKSPVKAFAGFVAVAVVLLSFHLHMKKEYDEAYIPQTNAYRGLSEQLDQWKVHLGQNGRMLLVNDPFPAWWVGWDPLFLVSLRDHTTHAVVNRLKFATAMPPDSEIAWYDYVVDYDSGWRLLKSPGGQLAADSRYKSISGNAPLVLLDGFGPPVRDGWRMVDRDFAMRVHADAPGSYGVSVSLSAQEPVRLSEQVDGGGGTESVAYPVGAVELVVPVPVSSPGEHTVRFFASRGDSDKRTDALQLIFVGAELRALSPI